jgi:hypothetical protein
MLRAAAPSPGAPPAAAGIGQVAVAWRPDLPAGALGLVEQEPLVEAVDEAVDEAGRAAGRPEAGATETPGAPA